MTTSIGKSIERIDVRDKVTGKALFSSDLSFPDMLHMKVLFSDRPHARIKSIDTQPALAFDGVLAVFTASDVPVNEYGYLLNDQPVLCGPGSSNPYGDRVRFVGDQVAVVIAESKEIAKHACKKIVVDYEDLPIISTIEDALKPDAYPLHPQYDSNVFNTQKVRTGDVEDAFSQADVIVESTYQTPAQEHAFLETEAGVSFIDENGRIALIVTGQWAHKDRKQIAHALDLPEEKIRVSYSVVGGAFGGREDISVQIILALATWRLHQQGIDRPVKIVWTREESIKGHGKRHPIKIHTKWGATSEGKIIAAEFDIVADGGAYQYTTPVVSSVTIVNCTGPYVIPNINIFCKSVYTNTVPRAAFRGFGGPQGAFVAEAQVNKLADALNMDPVEFRLRNVIHEGSLQPVMAPFPPGVSAEMVIEKCAQEAGWKNKTGTWNHNKRTQITKSGVPHIKSGIGFACSHKNVGFSHGYQEICELTLELHGGAEIEKVIVRHNATEVGQGTYTVIAQMTSEAIGVALEKIEVLSPDTTLAGDTGAVSASRMTFMFGNAIREAAEKALNLWFDEERPTIVAHTHYALPTTPADPETGHCDPMIAYAYTAEAAFVDVDTETGQVFVKQIICAEDVGKAINPINVEGQIEGGLLQGIGYAIMENFIEKDGYVMTPNLSTYLIPTVLDIPEQLDTHILEYPDPRGPWGARGVGEVAIMATAPAIVAAVHAATGVWIDQFPLTPERVLNALGKMNA